MKKYSELFFLICETGSTVSLNNMEYAVRKSGRHYFLVLNFSNLKKQIFGENFGVT